MKATLKQLLPALAIFAVIAGVAFSLPKFASADFATVNETCATASNPNTDYDLPTVDINGNVYTASAEVPNGGTQFSFYGYRGGIDFCVPYTIFSSGVSFDQFDNVGLRWVDNNTAEFYNYSSSSTLAGPFDIPNDPSLYAEGFGFAVYHGVTTDAVSSSFVMNFDADVNWQNPPFYGGMVTADFTQWWVCVSVTDAVTSFSIKVRYGDTVDADDYEDDTALTVGKFPVYSGGYQGCYLVDKGTDLTTPDEYWAIAEIYDQNDDFLGQTETAIAINIVSGTQVEGVPQTGDPSDPNNSKYEDCDNFTNTIRKYGCQIMVWAFIPNQTTLDDYADTRTSMEAVAPFSYFFQVKDAISEFDAETATIPTLTITNDALAMESEIFSPDTLETYVSGGTLSAFRLLMEAVLYFAFFGFVLYETRKLFNK